VAGFISEWWPASNRNPGRLQIGITGRLASEFAEVDAHVIAEGLGLGVASLQELMRASKITSLCERGVDNDLGLVVSQFEI
jgi:hypothetical protein